MKILSKTLLNSLALLALTVEASAQTVDARLELTLLEVPNEMNYSVGDKYFADLVYDQSAITGFGSESLVIGFGLHSIDLHFDGVVYDASRDLTNDYPQAYFSDGQLIGVDFWNNTGMEGGGVNSFFRFFKDQSFIYSLQGDSEYAGVYKVISVPEPKPSIYIFLAAGAIVLRRHRTA